MKKYCLLLAAMLFTCIGLNAQNLEEYNLDANLHGRVINKPVAGMIIYDDGGISGNYSVSRGKDYWVTVVGDCTGTNTMAFVIQYLDLRFSAQGNPCADTLFIYDGVDTSADMIWFATGNISNPTVSEVPVRPTNAMQALTLRFKVCNDCGPWNDETGGGFIVMAECRKPCEPVVPVLDSIFYKTRNGVVYEAGKIKHLYDYNEVMVWDSVQQDSVMALDSMPYEGVNLCIGDGVIFTAHCEYSYSTGWYHPTDSTSIFTWSMGTGDSISGPGVTSVYYDDYFRVECYDMILSVVDSNGCEASIYPQVRVRMAQNPLKTVFTLRDICNRDSLLVNMGYGGDDATLVLDSIKYEDNTSKTYAAFRFIPDGPACPNLPNCFYASVVFNDFPNGRTVQTKEDICSICVNYEHSYMGDYSLAIVCPNGKSSKLKYKDSSPGPAGTSGGGGRYAGIPYGGNDDSGWDKRGTGCVENTGTICDSFYNPFGVGYTYCFSRNKDYTLVNGDRANTQNPQGAGMANGPTTTSLQIPMHTVPTGYGFTCEGQSCNDASGMTNATGYSGILDSSDHENKMNYYTPGDDFSQLVGCPLNGQWSIEICDQLGIDNGWVFSFTVDICNVNTSSCQYQVSIDSLVWAPDTAARYHDYELGHYRGLEVHRHNDIESYVMTPDTAGTFPINVTIYDEFGCVWDTSTSITTFWTPKPTLGNDTTLCGVTTTTLDATDRHAATEHYTYLWEPFGQDSSQIVTRYEPGSDIRYIVQVNNPQRSTVCVTRDTINVKLRSQPYPSFVPIPFELEGCSPMTLTFDNKTENADKHLWLFGDGQYSEQASPTHTYTEGVYDVKYYVTSVDGCKDSLIFDSIITVYASPKASYIWEPNYPSVLQPTVVLTNTTENATPSTHYFWEMQYDRNNLLSVQTLTDDSPVHDFSTYVDPVDLAGSYTVRLIARNDNLAPSGNVIYCRDTTENTILLVNDFLQFPNVVTPNGDGINDKFIIGNLVGGMAYPVNTLDVYNKWGTRVFHKENIATEAEFWDPSDVPAGTYFYRFSARGYNGNIEHNGAVEVIK